MRFLQLLFNLTALVIWIFVTAVLMAGGIWWFGVPLFIIGLTIWMWSWERGLS